ncbi:MAG: tRNA 2-thiouridine(34) synthase MnmA [Marinilabiliales bacterium]|nr:tRNA 2-thiouridine(34) synthase MnmA [Marinilabiliales bacterium]
MTKKRVCIGLSGGVDSSVAAWLLKEQGYDLFALFMINWKETTGTITSSCTWEDDLIFAEMTAKKLDIPFHVVDLSEHYRSRVVEYMFSEYEKGRTPNPDVLCNREIKFDVFMQKAMELGADYVATGHYCRRDEVEVDGKRVSRLLEGVDPNKDQSYFLCQLSQEQLSKALFPIGHLLKPEVREIARQQGLITAERKDSQGICFVGKVDLPVFLQQQLLPKKGNVILVPASFSAKKRIDVTNRADLPKLTTAFPFKPWHGTVIGEHNGAHFYTIGQRKGLNIGGFTEPLFVLAIDVHRNIVYVGEGKEHPGLFRPGLFIAAPELHWIRPDRKVPVGEEADYLVRVRYRQPLEKANLLMREEGAYLLFAREQRSITAGQFAALYEGEELVASGVIA